jgi:hypothetical protein
MSNQTRDTFKTTDATDSLKDLSERERHLPTMPDPAQGQDAEVRLPTDKDPSKKPSLIHEPPPIGDEDDTGGLELIA